MRYSIEWASLFTHVIDISIRMQIDDLSDQHV